MNALTAQQDSLTGLAEQAEEYFALLEKQQRSSAEKLRVKMYRTVLESNNIQSLSDYNYLKNVISETTQKTAPLKEKFERCRQLCELYFDIAKTYYDISRGDYISRLVDEKQNNIQAKFQNDKHNKL